MIPGITKDKVFFEVNGIEYCNNELALAILLYGGVLFCNEREVPDLECTTTILFVQCSDIFVWGCAEGEPLPMDEIGELCKMHFENEKWGAIKWVCIKRNEKPQDPIVESMKVEGVWDDTMEKLPDNIYWKNLRERPVV